MSLSDASGGKMNLLIGKIKQYVRTEIKAALEKIALEPGWKERSGS